jgi:hypothetical protein
MQPAAGGADEGGVDTGSSQDGGVGPEGGAGVDGRLVENGRYTCRINDCTTGASASTSKASRPKYGLTAP